MNAGRGGHSVRLSLMCCPRFGLLFQTCIQGDRLPLHGRGMQGAHLRATKNCGSHMFYLAFISKDLFEVFDSLDQLVKPPGSISYDQSLNPGLGEILVDGVKKKPPHLSRVPKAPVKWTGLLTE